MDNCYNRALEVMQDNFGHIVEISLASCRNNRVSVREVNAYYRDGKVYVLSKASNSLMHDIAECSRVGMCHASHNIYGNARSLGHPLEASNAELRKFLKKQFSMNYNDYVDERDPEMRIVEITVTQAETFTRYHRYEIDFEKALATRDHTQPVYIYR